MSSKENRIVPCYAVCTYGGGTNGKKFKYCDFFRSKNQARAAAKRIRKASGERVIVSTKKECSRLFFKATKRRKH